MRWYSEPPIPVWIRRPGLSAESLDEKTPTGAFLIMGCLTGFEPATSSSTVRRSTFELQAPCRREFYHEELRPGNLDLKILLLLNVLQDFFQAFD